MRRFYLSVTLAFWLMVGAVWAGTIVSPVAAGAPAAPAKLAEHVISAAELGRHATPGDCWMAIRGSVYDITSYLPDHPSRPEIIEPWCGKEATQAYATKTKGRPHSNAADELLRAHRIGGYASDAAN
jgi:cytochrome b involved in lipid metabolism